MSALTVCCNFFKQEAGSLLPIFMWLIKSYNVSTQSAAASTKDNLCANGFKSILEKVRPLNLFWWLNSIYFLEREAHFILNNSMWKKNVFFLTICSPHKFRLSEIKGVARRTLAVFKYSIKFPLKKKLKCCQVSATLFHVSTTYIEYDKFAVYGTVTWFSSSLHTKCIHFFWL